MLPGRNPPQAATERAATFLVHQQAGRSPGVIARTQFAEHLRADGPYLVGSCLNRSCLNRGCHAFSVAGYWLEFRRESDLAVRRSPGNGYRSAPWTRTPSSPGSISERRPILRSPSPTPSQTPRRAPSTDLDNYPLDSPRHSSRPGWDTQSRLILQLQIVPAHQRSDLAHLVGLGLASYLLESKKLVYAGPPELGLSRLADRRLPAGSAAGFGPHGTPTAAMASTGARVVA